MWRVVRDAGLHTSRGRETLERMNRGSGFFGSVSIPNKTSMAILTLNISTSDSRNMAIIYGENDCHGDNSEREGFLRLHYQ